MQVEMNVQGVRHDECTGTLETKQNVAKKKNARILKAVKTVLVLQ
jgi:hypothetical protein